MQKTLIITNTQKRALIKHARKNEPNESCALLFGKEEHAQYTVKEIFFATNTDKSPINFTIANEELIRGYQEAEKKQLDVIGIFHSHPYSEPVPSATDRKFMEVNPVVWLIFSNIRGDFAAYILDTNIDSIPIKIDQDFENTVKDQL